MTFAQMMVPPVSAKNPVRRGAIHTITIGETWEVTPDTKEITVEDISRYLNDGGYSGVKWRPNMLSILLDVEEGKPKPSKAIRKGIRNFLKGYPQEFPAQFRHQYRYHAIRSDSWVDWFCSKYIQRHPQQSYKVILASRFPTEPFLYEHNRQTKPCYYEGGCYDHCGWGGELQRLNGRIVKIFKAETPFEILDRVSRKGEEGVENEVREWSAGRALLFPVDGCNKRGEESAYAVGNLYTREGIPLTLSALRRGLCDAIGWEDTGETVIKDGDGWYFNHTPYLIKSPTCKTPNGFFGVVDCISKTTCHCCGNDCDSDDMTTVDGNEVCQHCIDYHHGYCDSCDEITHDENLHTVADWSDGDERRVCECCIDNDSDIQSAPDWLRCNAYYIDLGR